MIDPGIRAALLRLLSRGSRARLANRAIASGLSCACLYLALLLALLLFGLPLLWFHLLFYSCLALLPLFLLLEEEESRTREGLRRLDDRCQAESYLAAAAPEPRAYLRTRVLALLERREAERALGFRLHPWNLRLAAAAGGLLLLYLAAGWLVYGSVRPTLSARSLSARQALAWEGGLAAGGRPGSRPVRSGPGGAEPGVEKPSGRGAVEGAGPAGEGARQPRGAEGAGGERQAVTLPPGETPAGEAEALPREAEGNSAEGSSAGGLGETGSPSERGLTEASGEGRALPLRPGGSEAGTGSTGRSLLESPLREYRTRTDRVQAEGGRRLAADSGPTVPLEAFLPPAWFTDLRVPVTPPQGFDPEIERLGRRYLEALDARF